MSSISPLQSSSSVEEFIAALQQIVTRNDSTDRSEGNVSIILNSKIQFIFSNCTNQDLLQALGEFFMWMMPYTESFAGAEREAEAEERERGKKICARKEIEDLFVRLLLPFAKSSDAIYSLCRSVGRIALTPNNTYFVTAAARDELLKLVEIAPCENSLQWTLRAICNLAYSEKDGVPIKSNPFICDEVSAIAYDLFCDSTVSKILRIAPDLLRIQVMNSTPQFCSADPYFAQNMLHKLDDATETEATWSIASLIRFVLYYQKQDNIKMFGSGEASHIFLSKLNSSDDPEVLREVCLCINNVACNCDKISDDFASPEMCRAIFKCFSKHEDEIFKNDIMYPIAALTCKLHGARSTFAQECPGLTQVVIEMLTTATHDKTRRNVAIAVAHISRDAESAKRLFNSVSLYEALIHAASRAGNEETKYKVCRAMSNATSVCTDFLPFCAARCPFYDGKQIELFKLDSLDSLISTLENREWMFDAPWNAAFLRLRSIFIVLEKIDQFLEVLDKRIEKGDERIEEIFLTIAKGFAVMFQKCWTPILGATFFDVTLSLLERSSGAANAVFANVICRIVMKTRPLSIHPSTVLRLLQKLDNSKELRDREHGGLKMELDIYKILEEEAVRNPELFRDNNFLVDNFALIRSCFVRSFEIHQFDANPKDRSLLKTHIEALYEVDPRMKQKMEGWDGQVVTLSDDSSRKVDLIMNEKVEGRDGQTASLSTVDPPLTKKYEKKSWFCCFD